MSVNSKVPIPCSLGPMGYVEFGLGSNIKIIEIVWKLLRVEKVFHAFTFFFFFLKQFHAFTLLVLSMDPTQLVVWKNQKSTFAYLRPREAIEIKAFVIGLLIFCGEKDSNVVSFVLSPIWRTHSWAMSFVINWVC